MEIEIHFTDKDVLECNNIQVRYNDFGINLTGNDEDVFVPYSNIKFVREIRNRRPKR